MGAEMCIRDSDTSLPIPLGSGIDRRLDPIEALLSP